MGQRSLIGKRLRVVLYCMLQVDKIVGKGAPEDFIQALEGVANSHHDQLVVDVIRAYFFGARYVVEVIDALHSNNSEIPLHREEDSNPSLHTDHYK